MTTATGSRNGKSRGEFLGGCSGGEGGNEYCKVEQSACCLDLSTYSVIVHVAGLRRVVPTERSKW
jgi:hypothetical protein